MRGWGGRGWGGCRTAAYSLDVWTGQMPFRAGRAGWVHATVHPNAHHTRRHGHPPCSPPAHARAGAGTDWSTVDGRGRSRACRSCAGRQQGSENAHGGRSWAGRSQGDRGCPRRPVTGWPVEASASVVRREDAGASCRGAQPADPRHQPRAALPRRGSCGRPRATTTSWKLATTAAAAPTPPVRWVNCAAMGQLSSTGQRQPAQNRTPSYEQVTQRIEARGPGGGARDGTTRSQAVRASKRNRPRRKPGPEPWGE